MARVVGLCKLRKLRQPVGDGFIYSRKSNKFLWGVVWERKYNVIGKFNASLKVENLEGREVFFILSGDNGQTISKSFELLPSEVL